MPKGLGKGYAQLTEEEKNNIVIDYYKGISIKDLIKIHKTTQRAVPQVLKERDINTNRKNHYTLNENYFEIINTEHKAYWLGFIAADGCITETNYFAMSLKDKEILLELKKDLEYTGDIYITSSSTEDYKYYRINFSSKKLCDDLRNLGIYENKSLTYDNLPDISDDLMPHFIRGYFDGDGSINSYYVRKYTDKKGKQKKRKTPLLRFSFGIVATENFCVELNNYLKNIINYDGKINKHNTKPVSYYNICDKKAMKRFYNYIYNNATIYLVRKYNIWQDFLGSLEE